MSRTNYLACAALCAVSLLTNVTSTGAAEIPSWLAARDSAETGRPLWVSAEDAAPNGSLRWELLHPELQSGIRQYLELNAKARAEQSEESTDKDACITWFAPSDAAGEAWSAEELFNRAGAVYSTRVEAVAQGFLNGNPGTLIRAVVEEAIKKPSAGLSPEEVFVFYRYAKIPLGDDYLCVRGARDPATPRVGGKLILAPLDPQPDYPEFGIYSVDDTEYFFEAENGQVSKPYAYRTQEIQASALQESLRRAGDQEKVQ